jgi:sec-independent protein translocase protein TatB
MLSLPHLIVLFIVALVIFGPQKLPELARLLGKATADFRRMTADFRNTLEDEIRDLDRQARLREWEASQAANPSQPLGTTPRALPELEAATPTESDAKTPPESATPASPHDELPSHADPDPVPVAPHGATSPGEKPSDDNPAV